MGLEIVILAAGKGKRMYSSLPKVSHQLAGVALLEWVLVTAQQLHQQTIHVVYGNGSNSLPEAFAHYPVSWIKQEQQLGTGHALLQALPHLMPKSEVLVLLGDVPLITTDTLTLLCEQTPPHGLGLVVAKLSDPSGLGRIVRSSEQKILSIVEEKDATPAQLKSNEIFSGILLLPQQKLMQWLPKLTRRNSQGEYYLTEVVSLAKATGCDISSVLIENEYEVRGVNSRVQLSELERYYQRQQAEKLLKQGVTLLDPNRFDLRGNLQCGQDIVFDTNVIIEGTVVVGDQTCIGPNCLIRNATVGKHVTIKANSVLEDVVIGDHCTIGPFARLRPGTKLAEAVKVGNFVEIKQSTIAKGTKINHLSYVGDAIIGSNVNIGAGTITCNYDGFSKHKTIIKDGAMIGSDTQLIAPVTIGAGATIGAGTTVRKDVPAGELAINNTQQISVPNWQPHGKKEGKGN